MVWYQNAGISDFCNRRIDRHIYHDHLFTYGRDLCSNFLYRCLEIIYCFYKIIPKAYQTVCICLPFIPSVVFWGSGFMKDTITLSCMGWVTHFFYLIFFENKKIVQNSFFALIFLYIIYIIKTYIVLAFLPAILLWGIGFAFL